MAIITFSILLMQCQEPGPTELVSGLTDQSDEIQIELLSPEPEKNVYSNGYDSTGVTTSIPDYSTLISLTHVKNSYKGITSKFGYSNTIFYNRNKPVYNLSNELVGYQSEILGRVMFNSDTARVLFNRISYLENGIRKDTVVGFRHAWFSRDPEDVLKPNIRISFIPFIGREKSFLMEQPVEINGSLARRGEPGTDDFEVILSWNPDKSGSGELEFIIGAKRRNNGEKFPFYRIKTRDDGRLLIPGNILKSIPRDRFSAIIFTLYRKKISSSQDNNLNDVYLLSQSIHNIGIEI